MHVIRQQLEVMAPGAIIVTQITKQRLIFLILSLSVYPSLPHSLSLSPTPSLPLPPHDPGPACESGADALYNTVWTLGCRPYMNSQRAACVCGEEEREEL